MRGAHGAPYNPAMIDLKAETQRFRAELRSTRWRKVILYSTVAGVVGIGAWAVTHYLLWKQEPPQLKMFTERLNDGVPMADEFLSYESVLDASAKLDYEQLRAEHTSSHKAPSRKYPPRDLDTLAVDGFSHLGQRGKMTLEFFNDRLYEARFQPEEVRDYSKRLHEAHPDLVRDKTGNIDVTLGERHVTSNVDFAASSVGRELNIRAYVIWQDARLKLALKLWEDTYGAGAGRDEKD